MALFSQPCVFVCVCVARRIEVSHSLQENTDNPIVRVCHADLLAVAPTKVGRIQTRKIIISLVHCQHAALLCMRDPSFFAGKRPRNRSTIFVLFSSVGKHVWTSGYRSGRRKKNAVKQRLNRINTDRMRTRPEKMSFMISNLKKFATLCVYGKYLCLFDCFAYSVSQQFFARAPIDV